MARSGAAVAIGIKPEEAYSLRSDLWQRRNSAQNSPRHLMLTGHGASLRVDAGSLLVRNGFTHYPQKAETFRLFPGDPELPKRIILLDCSGHLTFDVLGWLTEQQIPLVQINWRGEVVCLAANGGYSGNRFRVDWQRQTRADHDARMEYSISKITQKTENSITTLEKSIRQSPAWNNAMEAAYKSLSRLDAREPKTIPELRIIEANAAASYFRAWKGMPIKWRGTRRRPIPDSWKEFEQRSSPFHLAGNRNAAHPVNAMLNYAYTALQSEIQIRAVSEGYDPTIGIMHEESPRSSAFIFDEMEPFRPQVDQKLISFIKGQTFDPADFTLRSDGVCRLNPQLARVVIAQCGVR